MAESRFTRLLLGYKRLGVALLGMIGVILLLLAVALVLSTPLWFLATHFPAVFNGLFGMAVLLGGGYALYRRYASGPFRWGTVAIALTGAVCIGALLSQYPVVAVVSGVSAVTLIAWRVASI